MPSTVKAIFYDGISILMLISTGFFLGYFKLLYRSSSNQAVSSQKQVAVEFQHGVLPDCHRLTVCLACAAAQ